MLAARIRLGLTGAVILLLVAAAACTPRRPQPFTLTGDELSAAAAGLPSEVQDRLAAGRAELSSLVHEVLGEAPWLLTLVDKRHPLSADFVPPDLVLARRDMLLPVTWTDVMVSRTIVQPLRELIAAAAAEGVQVTVSSGYRSFEYQGAVYSREVADYGQEAADRESARPGMSQHQLGTAVDFGSISDSFASTPAGRFLAQHAWEHGFSLSYPPGYEAVTGYRYESWHYRYIGLPAARLQRTFFGDVQQYLLEFLAALPPSARARARIHY